MVGKKTIGKTRKFNGKRYTLSGWPLRTKSEAKARAARRRKEGYLARVMTTKGKRKVWTVWVRKR